MIKSIKRFINNIKIRKINNQIAELQMLIKTKPMSDNFKMMIEGEIAFLLCKKQMLE